MMDRRQFLQRLGLGAMAATVVPELDWDRLTWKQGERVYFLPSTVEVEAPVLEQMVHALVGAFAPGTTAQMRGNVLVTPRWFIEDALKQMEIDVAWMKHLNGSYLEPNNPETLGMIVRIE
jgi:hypothetical protein